VLPRTSTFFFTSGFHLSHCSAHSCLVPRNWY
jgi:hypothetical protein